MLVSGVRAAKTNVASVLEERPVTNLLAHVTRVVMLDTKEQLSVMKSVKMALSETCAGGHVIPTAQMYVTK